MEPSFLIFIIHLSDIPQSILQLEINNIFLSACQIFNFPPIKYSSCPSVSFCAIFCPTSVRFPPVQYSAVLPCAIFCRHSLQFFSVFFCNILLSSSSIFCSSLVPSLCQISSSLMLCCPAVSWLFPQYLYVSLYNVSLPSYQIFCFC
jgi:hypothetical protein